MTFFQKTALAALLATVLLIFVGAIVRVSGSGLGCPDWPRCWGALWPPSSIEEVDFDKIDFEKFRRKDGDITIEKLKAEFNPVHVWVEYINRLTSFPVGLFSLGTLLLGFGFRKRRPAVFLGSVLAFLLVITNAALGAMVVRSGLKPGIITLHMALAMFLLCVLVFVIHRAAEVRPRVSLPGGRSIWWIVLILFTLSVAEGVMGSQVRELTDRLALENKDIPREQWHETLEKSTIYLAHRSFSWVIVIAALFFFWCSRGISGLIAVHCRWAIFSIVLAQMGLGILMSHVSVNPVVQVLHIGLSALLVIALFWMLLGAGRKDIREIG
ncbi:MAG: COX15/CtaA family protein [Verrucomicrobiales bacterium]|nr:COX15/CtaA family protein [Verrucomicrobiales bacterium]